MEKIKEIVTELAERTSSMIGAGIMKVVTTDSIEELEKFREVVNTNFDRVQQVEKELVNEDDIIATQIIKIGVQEALKGKEVLLKVLDDKIDKLYEEA